MKKLFLAMIAMFAFTNFLFAQAYEGTLKVKKVEEPAIVMVYNYPSEIVENAFNARLTDKRLKGGKSRGFLVYNHAVINEVTGSPLDYSFKFTENGKRGKEATTVYMLMKGDNGLAKDPATLSRNAKSFLESMAPGVERSNVIAQIKQQEEIMVKEERKLKSLKDDQDDLEKKLQKNKKEQDSQQKVIESQRNILSDLKAKNI